jgi:hypothetical protein
MRVDDAMRPSGLGEVKAQPQLAQGYGTNYTNRREADNFLFGGEK